MSLFSVLAIFSLATLLAIVYFLKIIYDFARMIEYELEAQERDSE